MTHGGGWLTVTGVPVSQANDLLGASYQLYRYTGTNKTILRTVGYMLPAALHAHVQTVVPTTYFSPRKLQQIPRKRSREEAAAMVNATSGELVTVLSSRANDEVTPEILRRLYKTEAYVPTATEQNVLGIAGYKNDSPSEEDLTEFMKDYRPDTEDAKYTVELINRGIYDPDHPTIEGNLNIQYAEAMAYPTPHIYYITGGEMEWSESSWEPIPGDADLEWFEYILNKPKIPQTISISYGNDEPGLPVEYATALCDLFLQLGARGVSVLAGSGDDGVGEGDCKDEDGEVLFLPLFPATCTCGVSSLLCKQYTRQPRIRRSVRH